VSRWIANIDGGELPFDLEQTLAGYSVLEIEPGVYSAVGANGRNYSIRIYRKPVSGWNVEIEGRTMAVDVRDPRERVRRGAGAGGAGRQNVIAPMPGKVVRVLVAVGDAVEAGQGLIVVEAMKMQNEMKSSKAGTVVQILTEAGATVAVGETLVVIE
jgi:biotin carboxyl carrier protein